MAFLEIKQDPVYPLSSLNLSVTVHMYHKESETHAGKSFQEQEFRHIFFQLYRAMIDIQHRISKFKDKNLLINIFLYHKMITITIIALANTCIMSHSYHFLL